MKKIWLVFRGEYTDRGPVAAFSAEEQAKAFCGNATDEDDVGIEEIDLDPVGWKPLRFATVYVAEIWDSPEFWSGGKMHKYETRKDVTYSEDLHVSSVRGPASSCVAAQSLISMAHAEEAVKKAAASRGLT